MIKKYVLNRYCISGLLGALVFLGCPGCNDETAETIAIEDPIVPCGGDVIGTWEMTEAYIPDIEEMLTAESSACQGALSNQSSAVNGTMTFTADGRSNINGSLSQSVSMVLTAGCLKDYLSVDSLEVTPAFCDDLELLISATALSPFDAANCEFLAGACECDAQSTTAIVSSGSYSLPGNNTIVDQDGVASPYCVKDDTLLIETTGDEGAVVNLLLTQ